MSTSVTVKGFVEIAALVSNEIGVVSTLGEMSLYSSTFTKEGGEYENPDVPGYRLVSVRSYDTSGTEMPVPQDISNQIISFIKSVYSYGISHSQPYDLQNWLDTLTALYNGKVSSINLGTLQQSSVASYCLPQWVSFTSLIGDGATVKVWLADQAFQEQFDEYEITVVPPITPLDTFFSAPGIVKAALDARTKDLMFQQIQVAANQDPYTLLRYMSFNYTPQGSTAVPTDWAVLIYGANGDNIDAIKDAIVEYVLANSTHSRSEWEAILPDLFKRTEFIMLPRWDYMAIPDYSIEQGIYSALANPVETISFAQKQVTFYDSTFVQNNITILPHIYRTISIAVVNGSSNIETKTSFSKIFSDYIPVPTTSTDFNRQSEFTRNWALKLTKMLMMAESMDANTSVGTDFRKVKRNGQLWLSLMYDNVQYLMMPKYVLKGLLR
jgi:hypothetical protein